jgi:hypothetical protein
MAAKVKPIKKEEEVQQNSDARIDQDFPGFPHLPSTKKIITPNSATEKKSASVSNKKKSNKTYGG